MSESELKKLRKVLQKKNFCFKLAKSKIQSTMKRLFLNLLLLIVTVSAYAFDRTTSRETDSVVIVSDDGRIDVRTKLKASALSYDLNERCFTVYEMNGSKLAPTNKVIVYKPTTTIEKLLDKLSIRNRVEAIDSIGGSDKFYILTFTDTQPDSYVKIINDSGLCEFAEFEFVHFTKPYGVDNPEQNPFFAQQWHLSGNNNINIWNAWNEATGDGVTVGVIDFGIELNHPDLEGNRVAGVDFSADNMTEGTYHPYEKDLAHGTLVAGLISSINNSIGVVGVAPESKVVSLKIFEHGKSTISSSIVLECLEYVKNRRIDIVNMSFGLGYDRSIDQAITDLAANGRTGRGCVIVAASGNKPIGIYDPNLFPANHPSVISVGAIDQNGKLCYFSCYNDNISLVAPGVMLYTTNIGTGYRVEDVTGTSFSAPLVAGVAALMLSKNPLLKAKEVKEILCKSAYKSPNFQFSVAKAYGSWNDKVGYGVLDAGAALSMTNSEPTTSNITYGTVKQEAHSFNNQYYPSVNGNISGGTARIYPGGYAYITSSELAGCELVEQYNMKVDAYQFPFAPNQLYVTINKTASSPFSFRFFNRERNEYKTLNVWSVPLGSVLNATQNGSMLDISLQEDSYANKCIKYKVLNVVNGRSVEQVENATTCQLDISGLGKGVFAKSAEIDGDIITEKILIK